MKLFAGRQAVPALLAGNLLGAAAGAVFFFTAAHFFDLRTMGLYAAAMSTQWIVVGLVGMGLHVATVRLATQRLQDGEADRAAGLVSTATLLSIASGLAVSTPLSAGVGWLTGHPSSRTVALVAAWATARAVIEAQRGGLLARRAFGSAALLHGVTALTGLAALAVAASGGALTMDRLLAAHVLGQVSGGLFAVLLRRRVWPERGAPSLRAALELARYARWPGLAEGLQFLQVNLGPILLMAWASAGDAGRFGLARYPAFVFELVAVSLYQFWLPAAAAAGDREGQVRFLHRQAPAAAWTAAAMIGAAILASPFLSRLGPNFDGLALVFVLSAADHALLIVLRPIDAVFHGLREPWLELLSRAPRLPLLLVAAFVLARPFGAEGMAVAQILASLLGLAAGALIVRRRLSR